jgi:aryl-alcohol dehydrogenase-like predicted oxidoreductase
MFGPDQLPTWVGRVRQIEAAVAGFDCRLADIAMRFCVSNPHVAVTIPGVRTPAQARANAAASEPLPADLIEKLRQFA